MSAEGSSGRLRAPAESPAGYRCWVDERVRFADLDVLGHVNNKSFLTYAESGRVVFLGGTGLWQQGAVRQNVVARVEIDYRRELHFPADIRIGTRVLDIGRSSFRLGQGIFRGDDCIATIVAVMVRIDTQTRQAVVLNDGERAQLLPYLNP